jgi:anti-sigma B factor antagonist
MQQCEVSMSGVIATDPGSRASFEVVVHRGVVNVRVCGELDLASAGELGEVLGGVRAHAGDLVQLDARGVEFIDCSALGVIDHARHTLAGRGATLWIVSPSMCVRALLDMTRSADLLAPGDATEPDHRTVRLGATRADMGPTIARAADVSTRRTA